jgi:hypothetical protein
MASELGRLANALMKWKGHPNLQRRPAKPALGKGRIQRAVRRAFYFGSEVTSSAVYDWVYPHRRHLLTMAHRHSARRVLLTMADPIGRANTIGRPWLWRLRAEAPPQQIKPNQGLLIQTAILPIFPPIQRMKNEVEGRRAANRCPSLESLPKRWKMAMWSAMFSVISLFAALWLALTKYGLL